jgi:hypothetical protein
MMSAAARTQRAAAKKIPKRDLMLKAPLTSRALTAAPVKGRQANPASVKECRQGAQQYDH